MKSVQLIAEAADKLLKYAQQHSQSLQPGDVHKALFDSKVLGLVGPEPKQAQFDLNGPVADFIFGLMDKFSYKGSVALSVKVTSKGGVDVMVESQNPKLSAALKQAFLPKVTQAVKPVLSKALPAEDIVLSKLVVAQNA